MLNRIDLSRTDLNLLVLFEVVLQERHVGRAARRLDLSPSAVSHGLARLRRMLGDPLFLRMPKGVVPTARASALAEPIADVLARVRNVVAGGQPFDPANSARRFVVGAPDGVSAGFLPSLLSSLRRTAPGIDIGVRELLPPQGGRATEEAWGAALAALDARAMDIAVLPLGPVPARFAARTLYEEDFVVAMRAGHPFARRPTLDRFCGMRHLVVSLTADAAGFVDAALAKSGRSRRVVLTVPNFTLALTMIAETDLIAALPRQVTARHAGRFGVTVAPPPLPLPRFRVRAIVPKVALLDAGVAWLHDSLVASAAGS